MLSEPRFDQATREDNIAAMAADPVDVLVIGGGIIGAAIARDSAMRGLRTALVEKGDFGSGTSGKSSRLIHGALRYLELGDWRQVYEASRERRILMNIAPHLVWPTPFLLPIHAGTRLSIFKVSAGLSIHDALGLFRNVRLHRMLTKRRVLRIEPSLRSAGLKGAGLYYDARCDDARLTLATVRSAHVHGALVANYVGADELERAGGEVCGARVTDALNGDSYLIQATVVVNAAGPWSDEVRAGDAEGPVLRRTKGVHVVVPQRRLGNNQAVTLLSPIDGRVMFIVPWGELSYVGTTDTDYLGAADDVKATGDDVVYLLRSANALYPRARLGPDDVISTWTGVRSLVQTEDHDNPSAVPRDHFIAASGTGLISVLGGRLTTHRRIAAEAVDRVSARLHDRDGRRAGPRPPTDTEALPGGEVKDLDVLISELVHDGFSRHVADHIVRSVGTESAAIARMTQADHSLAQPVVVDHPTVRAQLAHAVRREMAVTLCDILIRRTNIFHAVTGHAVPEAPGIVDLVADELGWDASRKATELAHYLHEIQLAMAFRDELHESGE